VTFALALAIQLTLVSGAVADRADALPTDAQAVEHLRKGNRLMDLDKWAEAIAEYEQGALLDPVPIFFYNIGLAHRNAGQWKEAIRTYRVFLSKIDDDPNAATIRTQIEQIISDMENAASRPPNDPQPGTLTSNPSPPSPENAEPSTFTTKRKLALGVGAVGLVAAVGGIAFDLRAGSQRDAAAALCPTVTCDHASEANALGDRADGNTRNAYIAFGVGAAAVIGAGILWLTGAPHHMRRTNVAAAIHLSTSFSGIDVTMSF